MEGREKREGRRGGEKRKMKRIVGIMMIILLMMGCGQQRDVASKGVGSSLSRSMMEIGRNAENAFYSFIELMSDVLGFTAKSDTTKNKVGEYFVDLGKKIDQTSAELEEVAKKTETEIDKSDSSKNLIKESVNSAKAILNTLRTNLDLLGTISTGDSNVVGYANSSAGSGTAVATTELKKALKALQEIVKAAISLGVKALESRTTTVQVSGGADNKDGAKILATSGSNPGTSDAGKAAAILATVSGEEVLAEIVASKESDAALSSAASGTTTAVSFAMGGSDANLSNTSAKASAVAGGIALRSLIKDGKLASGAADNATGGGKEVQGVGVTAANKLLVAVEDIIKKTVKKVIEKTKGEIDKARGSKTSE